MEEVLAKLLKDSSPVKHASVRQSCVQAQELLANQHELMRSPPCEIRSKCLETLKLALESKHSKLISHSLSGFQRLVWDKNFQTIFESDDDETWLPCQLLSAVISISTQNDDVQMEIFKILVQMTSTSNYNLSSRAVIRLISLCIDVYSKGSASVRTAAQATANQTLQSFCLMIQEPDIGNEENNESGNGDTKESGTFNLVDGVVEDLFPILEFTCEKLKSVRSKPDGKSATPLLLQCLLSIFRNLKVDVRENQTFLKFLWQELCPRLVALLGSPKTDRNIVSSQKSSSGESTQIGRGSGCLATAPSCHNAEAKTINSIAVELVRMVGSIASLRPVLESLFHRMLLYPPPQHRLEALKAIRELFHNPDLFLKFAGPPLYDTADTNSRSSDLDLIHIAMDSLGECCHSTDSNVCYMGVSCATELLRSLEQICKDTKHIDVYANEINSLFKLLEDADYKGIKSSWWQASRKKEVVVVSLPVRKMSSEYSDSDSEVNENEDDDKGAAADDEREVFTPEEEEIVTENNNKHEVEDISKENPTHVLDVETQETAEKETAEKEAAEKETVEKETVEKETVEKVTVEQETVEQETVEQETVEQIESSEPGDLDNDPPSMAESAHEVSGEYISSSTTVATSSPMDNDDINILQDLEDHERELEEEAADRLNKVPRTLLGQEDAGKVERERVEQLCVSRLEFAQRERKNAQNFVQILSQFLPKLLAIRSSVEADQALQEFSSNYCEGLWDQQHTLNDESEQVLSHITILNADGIYLALYSALLLNLKLIRCSYYNESSATVPLTEDQFIQEVHGTGVLVYLSATWLAELYQHVLSINLLEQAGYSPKSSENSALVNLLSDVDGLGNSQPGGQQLADYRRLERAVVNVHSSPNMEAGRKFARRIISSSWEVILEVLSVLLNGTNSCGITSTIGFLLGTEGAKEEHRRTRDAIAESLDGLQLAAKLCNGLGLQSSCSAVFAQLAATSCPLTDEHSSSHQSSTAKNNNLPNFKKSLLPGRNRSLRLHTSHALSMEVMLSRGLELGSHTPSCWRYVFQCCLYVLELENVYFSNYSGIQSVLTRPTLQAMKKAVDKKDGLSSDMGENGIELLPMPGSAIPMKLNISEMIKQNNDAHTSGVVRDQLLLEVVEGLSQLVDRLFEEAAARLNLCALIGFLVELCAASQMQLYTSNYRQCVHASSHGNSLLLYHLGDIMLRCARGGRPLIHVMKVWSIVAPHFVEAACHKDRMISKKAITTIHDIVSALLSSNGELLHFHVNEALFKPFENLLCLELCDTDVQEQIISSICEFVEGCTTDIRSGWRPLFGALRAVRLPTLSSPLLSSETEREHAHHLRVVLDVFEAFLGTDNISVFAHAAVDCLLCLLKHVKGSSEELPTDLAETVFEESGIPLDMCLAALKYLNRCNSILGSMYNMPACPVFNSANRIQVQSTPVTVDKDIVFFHKHCTDDLTIGINSNNMAYIENVGDVEAIPLDTLMSLKDIDKHTGILHVWFLLLEGLAGAVATCPKRYQPHTIETFFNMLRNLKEAPGAYFGIYCINHLLLPMLQSWMRRFSQVERGWANYDTNFKQCCGLATDLVVDYIQFMTDDKRKSLLQLPDSDFMLQQLFIVLTECISQSSETISRLGCACIRHTILSAGNCFTPGLWDIACASLQTACHISLHHIKQLMVCFHADSENFYGDLMDVKVAARKDSTPQESERLKQLAYQVFLLDCQRAIKGMNNGTLEDLERSYVFLLQPPTPEGGDADSEDNIIRVPFQNLIVCLLSHQILLQTLSTILLHSSRHLLPGLSALLLFLSLEEPNSSSENELPGFLSKLSSKQINTLFGCLKDSYQTACDFDARPGLKFLIQKVARIPVAANLYKQTGVSWTAYALALFELCLATKNISMQYVNSQIEQQNTNDDKKILPNFFIMLMKKFKDICELYAECAMDKDGLLATVDRMTDQPIFFLVAPPDNIADLTACDKKSSEENAAKSSTEDCNEDSSDSEGPVVEDSKDKVYSLATEQTISKLMNEFKKRKTRHSMPSILREKLQRKSRSFEREKNPCDDSVPDEILKQRRASITKDGEAHVQVFKQLVQSVLELHLSLKDEEFRAFLPIFFPGVQYLVAYAVDAEVKLTTAEWLQRVAACCGFSSTTRNSHS